MKRGQHSFFVANYMRIIRDSSTSRGLGDVYKRQIHDGLSGRTPWHQDAAVLNSRGQKLTDMVTVWIPFTKTTKKNGCMITVKKINKMGLLNHISGYRLSLIHI